MAEDTKESKGNGGAKASVAFDYIKNHNFRSIRADGAIGGPHAERHHSFRFVFRAPIYSKASCL